MSFWQGQEVYLTTVYARVILIALIFLAILAAVFAFGLYRNRRMWRLGQAESRSGQVFTRLKTTVGAALSYTRIFKESYPGVMHFLILWGSVLFVLGKIVRLFSYPVHITTPPQDVFLYASLVSEIGVALIFIGGLLAIYRRYIRKPSRLDTKSDDTLVFVWVFMLLLTGFMVKGYRIAAGEASGAVGPTDWAMWSPISYGFSKIFLIFGTEHENEILVWHRAWFHTIPVLLFLAYIFVARSRMQHILLAPLNVFFRSLKPKGALTPIDLETAESYGAAKIEDFTWKQLMDLDACVRCGRCQDNCPAHLTAKALSPKKVIQDLKDHFREVYPIPLLTKPPETRPDMIFEAITEEVVWDCTTCRACQEACPVFIEHIDKIVDMRRNLVLEHGQMPETVEGTLRCIETRGHACRGTTLTRVDWAQDLGIRTLGEGEPADVLFWVGCQASLEERSTKIAIAFARILQAAGVNFAILGDEETCCGDPARRLGNEYLFQTQAAQNIEILRNYGIKKIVATCPHCFNTLKNEYPQFDGHFEVLHHTEFIAELLRKGSIRLTEGISKTITYHDGCYLGRHNDVYEAPREVLKRIPQSRSVEMAQCRERGFCCGGGGGHFWVEEKAGMARISEMRTQHVLDTKAGIVATACPYCLQMFEDAIKAKDAAETLKAMDLSELVVEALSLQEIAPRAEKAESEEEGKQPEAPPEEEHVDEDSQQESAPEGEDENESNQVTQE